MHAPSLVPLGKYLFPEDRAAPLSFLPCLQHVARGGLVHGEVTSSCWEHAWGLPSGSNGASHTAGTASGGANHGGGAGATAHGLAGGAQRLPAAHDPLLTATLQGEKAGMSNMRLMITMRRRDTIDWRAYALHIHTESIGHA